MEQGSELSKTVATFILQKILTDDTGLAYICQTYERFSHVAKVLGLMVINLGENKRQTLRFRVIYNGCCSVLKLKSRLRGS